MTDNRSWRGETTLRIFGRRAVLEALDAAAHDRSVSVHLVRVSNSAPSPFRHQLGERCRQLDAQFERSTDAGVAELSGDRRNDQGVAAVIELNNVWSAEEYAEQFKGRDARDPVHLIAVDAVTNPQNLGMIVRSAAAAGFRGILWPMVGSPWVNGLVIKSSASTIYRFPVATCGTLLEGIAALQSHGFEAFGLAAGASESIFSHKPPHRAVYVIGSETQGLSDETIDALDSTLSIPMAQGVESLNAAVAAGVLCFQINRAATTAPATA